MKPSPRAVAKALGIAVVLCGLTGCASVRSMVALPFDMAAHVAAETAKLPYETAKMGAQGLVDVIAGAMR